jgi:DNA-binding transcriptional MerR regulator
LIARFAHVLTRDVLINLDELLTKTRCCTVSAVSSAEQDRGFTMGEMSARSGVSEATLRMWETRHDFPRPQRAASGHRRYSERDLARVRAVVRGRERGLSLQAAIELAQDVGDEATPSVYASLRERFPLLEPQVLSKRAMLALSRAIEDECLARAERPILFGCFQRERFYRASQNRWDELSRTAERAVVLADFPRIRTPRGCAIEVPIAATDPIAREWAIVCESPSFGACLAGWERPATTSGGGERVFEAAWTIEAPAVRLAAQACWRLASASAPDLLEDLRDRLYDAPVAREHELRSAIQLSARMVRYATAS